MSEKKILPMSPDMSLIEEIRQDYTAKTCVSHLLNTVSEMAQAVGVTISYEIAHVEEEKIVDQEVLTTAMSRLSTVIGSLLVGCRVNPITTLKAQDPIQFIREYNNVEEASKTEADRKAGE